MTHGFCRMPLAPEMNSLQAEIRSNQCLVTGGDLQDGTIVHDAAYNSSSSDGPTTDTRDQLFFGDRQDEPNIVEWMLEWAKSGEELISNRTGYRGNPSKHR